MAFPLIAAVAAGSALQLGGSFLGGEAEKEEAKRQARLADKQASEILARSKINQEAAIRQGFQLSSQQASAFARGGVDVSSGSPLLVQTQALSDAKREAQLIGREARFQAALLRKGAASGVKAAKSRARASLLGSFGQAIGGAASSGAFGKLSTGSGGTSLKTGEPVKTSSIQEFTSAFGGQIA